jgi:predicted phosphate transport protein (TIGR00153 family)
MSVKKIFSVFSRGEKQILEQITDNLDLSLEAAQHLLLLVQGLKAHDFDAVRAEYRTIDQLESKADEVHMKVVENICTGSFFGGIREDLLALLEEIDNIADCAKDAGKIFLQRRMGVELIDYLFKADVLPFVQECIDTVGVFKQAIAALNKSKEQVIKLANDVERHEEKADAIRATVLEHLLRNDIGANALDVVMLKDFLNTADSIADNAEDGSDVLLILIAKGYA